MLLLHHNKPVPKIVRNQILKNIHSRGETQLLCKGEVEKQQENHFIVWKIASEATEK